MSRLDFTFPTVVLRTQLRIALIVPLIVTRVIAPGELSWAVAAVGGVTVFALLHRRSWQVWLVPVCAIVAAIPEVPTLVAFLIALACGVFLQFVPPLAVTTQRPAIEWVISVLLGILAIGVVVLAILTSMNQQRTFAEAQNEAAEAWNAPLIEAPGGSAAPTVAPESSTAAPGDSAAPASPEAAPAEMSPPPGVAAISFTRPGSTKRPVTKDMLFVRPGVSEEDLTQGPGVYPGSAAPGQLGNLAIAGHRTGWGEPFARLDELVTGDRVIVEDEQGSAFEYEVEGVAYVKPDEVWVLGPDPLGTGLPTLTLTTCDPPGVNSRRLVVWATLVTSAPA